jgi:hypothetical protein
VLQTPRSAAVPGILFALLFGLIVVLQRRVVPSSPYAAGAWLTQPDNRRELNVALTSRNRRPCNVHPTFASEGSVRWLFANGNARNVARTLCATARAALGTMNTPTELVGFLRGELSPTRHEYDVVAVALNEYLSDIGVARFVPYVQQLELSDHLPLVSRSVGSTSRRKKIHHRPRSAGVTA